MCKKLALMLSLVFLTFQVPPASAITINYMQIYTDNRAVAGYTVWAGAALSGDPEHNATVSLEKQGEVRQIPLMTYFYDQVSHLFKATAPAPVGFGGSPSDFEDVPLTFTITDPETAPAGITINVTPNGFTMVQMMNGLSVLAGGLNPTIGWTDPGGSLIHHYTISVFDSLFDRVYLSPNLSYNALGGSNGTFWFDPNDRVIGGKLVEGFTFLPDEDYTIRVEGRRWLNVADFDPDQPGAFYLNRSVTEIGYDTAPIPEPATMLLLGSGLMGLAGFRKKFRNSN